VNNANIPHHKAPLGLRTVAIFELIKGSLVLLVGLGLLSLIHRDVQAAAEQILHRFHIDPAWHYSRIFVERSARLTDASLRLLTLYALLYAIIRFVEAYGLWHERHWAEWFAVISAGIYLPVEAYHFSSQPSWHRAALFVFNLLIVIYLGMVLTANHRKKAALQAEKLQS
jgi:uncharacterized membrane protein (DUF2068 family)